MKKDEVISILMDFQNQLLAGLANSGLINKDKLYRAIFAGVTAISESSNDEFIV